MPAWRRFESCPRPTTDFKAHRLNGAQRAARGVELRRRRYNKDFRAIVRLEQDVAFFERLVEVKTLLCFGRAGFAAQVPWAHFVASVNSAALVAYRLVPDASRRHPTKIAAWWYH